MNRFLIFFICACGLISESVAATIQSNATQTSAYNYNYMYPFMNNQMRTELNPGTSVELNANPINAVVRTEKYNNNVNTRRVVSRPSPARTAIPSQTSARGATTQPTNAARRVVARSAIPGTGNTGGTRAIPQQSGTTRTQKRNVVARTARGDASYLSQSAQNAADLPESTTVTVSSSRCLADYMNCMNGYCVRENTAYNRCYCSSRLSQIDAQYQPAIDDLIKQIIVLQGTNHWTDAEMNEYWMETVGKYRGENSWTKLDDALNIDWSTTESRVRGQQAFATGHDFCVQHLRGCYYMASNMRDAYRSEISRDCNTYENNLAKIKNIAETVIEALK